MFALQRVCQFEAYIFSYNSHMTDTNTPSTAFDPTELLASLQHLPGVYRHIGVNDEVLYVGKAKVFTLYKH